MGKQREHQPIAQLDPTENNVALIARLEEEALHQRTLAERVSDAITRFTGSMTFLLFHALLFAFWIVVNLSFFPGVKPFDPFPLGILTLIVSTEGVFLAIFILVSQNRTEWEEFRSLKLSRLRKTMRTAVLINARNIINPAVARSSGFDYSGIGR